MTISTQSSWVTDPHHECHRMCERTHHGSHLSQAICKNKCNREYQSPEHHSQISEKLAASAKSLYDESEKLLLIAEEIYNQDPMNF